MVYFTRQVNKYLWFHCVDTVMFSAISIIIIIIIIISVACLWDKWHCWRSVYLHVSQIFFPQEDLKRALVVVGVVDTVNINAHTHTLWLCCNVLRFRVVAFGAQKTIQWSSGRNRVRQVWECWLISFSSLLSDPYLPVWLSHGALTCSTLAQMLSDWLKGCRLVNESFHVKGNRSPCLLSSLCLGVMFLLVFSHCAKRRHNFIYFSKLLW